MGINLSATLSGLEAASVRLNVSADNVARRIVEGSEKNRVVAFDKAEGGVTTAVQKVPLTEEERSLTGYAASNIDYAEEITNQIIARTSFEANASSARTQLNLTKTLLDIKV